MPITGYLKIDDIAGESKAAEHEDEIDVFDLGWQIERDIGSRIGRGRVRSRVVASPLVVSKYYDASSPYLALAVAQGRSFKEAVLSVRKDSGDAHLDYLTITMQNVLISGYEMDGLEDMPVIAETVELSFEAATVKYVVQAEDHSAGDTHEVEIDLTA